MQSEFTENQIQNHFVKSLYSSASRASMQKAVRIAKFENPQIARLEEIKGDDIETFVFDWMRENLCQRHSMKARVLHSLVAREDELRISTTIFLNAIRDYMRRNPVENEEPPINNGITTLQQIADCIAFSNYRTTVVDFPNTPLFNINRMYKVQKASAVERQMRRWEKSGIVSKPDLKIDGSVEGYFSELKRLGIYHSTGISALMTLVPYSIFREMTVGCRSEYERTYSVRLVPEFLSVEDEIEFGINSGCLYRDEEGQLCWAFGG